MHLSAKIRFIATASIAFSTLLPAQTGTAQQPPIASQQSQPQALHQAKVAYTDGKLFVSANNSSLNQILRDIGRETGMKITGGVTEERVFGQYGPAAPSKVLEILLDGTGSNMLLLQATAATPAELILTPRRGGATPPNPNASAAEDDSNDGPVNRAFPPPSQPQYPPATPPATNAPGNSPASEPTQPQSPNAPKTPQQIYEQLQRLRQQQQQQQSNPP